MPEKVASDVVELTLLSCEVFQAKITLFCQVAALGSNEK